MPKFTTTLLATALSRIDEWGNYHSPNICFESLADPIALSATKEDVVELKADLAKVSQQVKTFAESINADVAAGRTMTAEVRESVDKLLTEQGALRARIDELEQKGARRGGGDMLAGQTPGQRFISDPKVIQFMADRINRGRVRVDMAAITTGTAGATRDVLVPPQRQPGIITPGLLTFTVRDLLTPGRTSQNSIQYVRETGFTNLAGPVSEGDLKPESGLTFELKTVPVSTVAHFMLASKQILDDAPMLQSHIDGRLRYGLAFVEEQQLLNGDGTGVNLHGIVPQATAYAPSFVPAMPTQIDTIRLAILQSEIALFPATGVVLHPIDWARIELTKTTVGEYIFAQVQSMAGPTLWGRPVVSTMAMSVDKFLAGAFLLGAQIFDREDANVEISTEDSDNFRRNLVTIRAEERLALAVYRPEAFIYGDFGNVT